MEKTINLSLKEGDLIFWVKKSTAVDDISSSAFERAVVAVSSDAVYHVALVVGGGRLLEAVEVVHALPSKGVVRQPLSQAAADVGPGTTLEFFAPDLSVNLCYQSAQIALKKLGASYNDIFVETCVDSQGREAYYCCQLVRKCYEEAAGRAIFPTRSLNFRSSEGKLIEYWVSYFAERGLVVPEDGIGSHPEQLRVSPLLHKLGEHPLPCLGRTLIMARYVVPKDVTSALNFVAGARVKPSTGGRTFTFVEPRTGKAMCEVPTTDEKHVDDAVRAAKEAFPGWAALSGLERGKLMRKAAETIRENVEEIARWEVRTNGKSITEARIDILSSADTWEFYGGLAATIVGEHMPLGGSNRFAYTRREPLGVVGGIGAWNYPFQTASWKMAPALACGNAFVYKPSPLAPITAVILAELLTHSGIPKGVVNVVQGEKETGEALCLHADVNKVSFTGSVPTGQAIMKMCATRNIKPVTLELGGKSALIIFDDADIDNAVVGAMLANYLTQGEVCTNASRVFVHKSVLKEFTDKLLVEVKKLAAKVGDPLLDETRMGATICQDHMNKVLGYIDSARKEGATILFGGERVTPSSEEVKDGFYLSPCVITDTKDSMKVVREEIFGAVMLIIPFDTEEEVIERTNNTSFGLAAGLFSRNMRRAYEVAARLNAGTVFVNTYNDVDVAVPFGGVRNSGFGRENGVAALQHYVSIKSVYVDTSDKISSPF